MTLIRDGRIAADDYVALADDAAPAGGGRVIVSLERWRKDEALKSARLIVGVRLPNTQDVAAVWDELRQRPLIALEFPDFTDGRAYSQAHDLRMRLGYQGELRATGAAVVKDQLFGMARCGFNSFELRADQDPERCVAALKDFSIAYQPAAAPATTVFRRRRSA